MSVMNRDEEGASMIPGTLGRRTRPLALLAVSCAALTAATAGGATGTNQHITLSSVTVHGADKAMHAVATGRIHAAGSFTGSDTQEPGRDLITLRFRNGTVTLSGNEQSTKMTPDLRSCTAKGIGRGTFAITGGTGAYDGISGSGTYTRHTSIVGARSAAGACLGEKAQPKLIRYRATHVGTIALP
jgi:hypothetical protein